MYLPRAFLQPCSSTLGREACINPPSPPASLPCQLANKQALRDHQKHENREKRTTTVPHASAPFCSRAPHAQMSHARTRHRAWFHMAASQAPAKRGKSANGSAERARTVQSAGEKTRQTCTPPAPLLQPAGAQRPTLRPSTATSRRSATSVQRAWTQKRVQLKPSRALCNLMADAPCSDLSSGKKRERAERIGKLADDQRCRSLLPARIAEATQDEAREPDLAVGNTPRSRHTTSVHVIASRSKLRWIL